jgi:hypothetical protein
MEKKIIGRSSIKMGQMLKECREKRENSIRLKVGRNNKMGTGGSHTAQHLLTASPHRLPLP